MDFFLYCLSSRIFIDFRSQTLLNHSLSKGPRPKRQNFQTNFDFQSSFDEIKQNFRPNPNNIELVLEETASPVPPTVRGQYVTPTAAAYVAETHAPTEAYQEPSTTQYVTEASISNQYHYPPYTPPKAAVIKPQTETFYIGASTKPPVIITKDGK